MLLVLFSALLDCVLENNFPDYYYVNFGDADRTRIRVIVLFTFILEVVQTILVARDSYILFCAEWGVPSALLRVGLLWLYIPIMGSLSEFEI